MTAVQDSPAQARTLDVDRIRADFPTLADGSIYVDSVASSLTPVQVGRFLMGLARRLDELVSEYGDLGRKAAEAKRDAAIAEARAYIESAPEPGDPKRTVDERKAITTLGCADELFEADLAKAQVDHCKEALRALHARLDVGRTLSATSREEMRMSSGQT